MNDETIDPTKFLQIHSITIPIIVEDELVMANYFHVVLTGPTQSWLMNLLRASIWS